MNEIAAIEFGILPPDEIRRIAVVDVHESMLYERGLPKVGSVIDLRMGTTDRRYRCSTCKHSVIDCNGHFGACLHTPRSERWGRSVISRVPQAKSNWRRRLSTPCLRTQY
tara:strand:- start:18888 stop:19217 length:330 start_codon:yes stop_codon:yes gene_type:complete